MLLLSPKSTLVRLVQAINIAIPISVKLLLFAKVTELIFVAVNAHKAIDVTLDGIVKFPDKLEHQPNADCPIVVSLDGRVKL